MVIFQGDWTLSRHYLNGSTIINFQEIDILQKVSEKKHLEYQQIWQTSKLIDFP